jgi:hypothetical protein
MQHEELTKIIIDCAYTVHNTLGQVFGNTQIDIGLLINFGRSVEVKRKFRLYTKTKI